MGITNIFLFLTGFTMFTLVHMMEGFDSGKVCRGTRNGLTHQRSGEIQISMLRTMLTNCTYLDGNLELTFLENRSYDLSFLKDIKEVTGYVLIVGVWADQIPLTSLRIIRGRDLYQPENEPGNYYSLFVAYNYKPESTTVGLKQLGFTSLYEILEGDVYFFKNNLLCYEHQVNWNDILTGNNAKVIANRTDVQNKRRCASCHPKCVTRYKDTRYCWGEGPDMCQKLTRITCSPQCEGRCFGPNPQDCCNSECAGGCTGPTKSECWACKNFNNNGSCVPFCPPQEIYNTQLYRKVPNPFAKYTFGTICLDECPVHMFIDEGSCVNECGEGEIADTISRRCVKCDGPCPKTCDPPDNKLDMVDANYITKVKDCTIIRGNLRILSNTFKGDTYNHVPPMHPSRLSVLGSVREVRGYVMVQASHPDFTDLSFLGNLSVIQGHVVQGREPKPYALHIFNTPSLTSLNLTSLRSIQNNMVFIRNNSQLCYVNTINWRTLRSTIRTRVADNRPHRDCVKERKVCHPQCSTDGCWGPGDENCLSCANYHYRKRCVESCDALQGVSDAGGKTCKKCDLECATNCTGLGPDNCVRCKHMKDGPYCVPECPKSKYSDENNVCQACHANCDPEKGCVGPRNTIGPDACISCLIAVIADDGFNVTKCLPPDSYCDDGFYMKTLATRHLGPMAGKQVCMACHPECRKCTGPGLSFCDECIHYDQEQRCVANCTSDYYTDHQLGKCLKCDDRCLRCRGPTASDCISCKQYKMYYSMDSHDDDTKFNCTEKCPAFAMYKISDNNGDTLCVPESQAEASMKGRRAGSLGLIIGSVVSVVIIVCGIIIVVYFCNKRSKAEENKMRLAARMSGLDDDECVPLTPTGAMPDMATLRLIKESELRKGAIIGSGAFGTVFKGAWLPEGEGIKIPVAIKLLQEGTSPSQNQELLEEARIMFSVNHPCCVRILAVCLTAQMMLITQLMPLGCLLDYVRKHRQNISSKVLLNWCTQIAKGMTYLEERQIVHRDLAARNVLVQNAQQVKITDFGLAKLLDLDVEEFHAAGGKMPIKWLALECIQHRIFTHKSDVWSFGVTLWELFTYGQRPYENVRAREIPDLLEKGERLPQPSIATIDVYMIMIKCWMLDAQSRPSFRELSEEFAKMARDPGRYLVIPGDKWMRLPSVAFDSKDLIRSLSIADGPEEIIDAEEYLHPQEPDVVDSPQNKASVSDSDYDNDAHQRLLNDSDRPGYQHYSHPRSVGLPPPQPGESRYSSLEMAAAAKKEREGHPPRSSVNSRYSADPCRIVGDREDEPDGTPPMPPVYNGGGAQPAGPRLPVDEDDYLQPKSSNKAAYMDLVGPEDIVEEKETTPGSHPGQYLEMSSNVCIDNPEYFNTPSSPGGSTNKAPPPLPPAVVGVKNRRSSGNDPAHYIKDKQKRASDRGQVHFKNTSNESKV